jgi:hypothetical protein
MIKTNEIVWFKYFPECNTFGIKIDKNRFGLAQVSA